MAQATNSLHQASEPFQPISRSTICILARLAAKKIIKEQLRDAGVRVTLVFPAEIAAKANEYLSAHPELYAQARERAVRLGLFEKPKRRAKVINSAQTKIEPISMGSAVQISGAK